eukprot:6702192-Pyramimonas_sp.AAC.1
MASASPDFNLAKTPNVTSSIQQKAACVPNLQTASSRTSNPEHLGQKIITKPANNNVFNLALPQSSARPPWMVRIKYHVGRARTLIGNRRNKVKHAPTERNIYHI